MSVIVSNTKVTVFHGSDQTDWGWWVGEWLCLVSPLLSFIVNVTDFSDYLFFEVREAWVRCWWVDCPTVVGVVLGCFDQAFWVSLDWVEESPFLCGVGAEFWPKISQKDQVSVKMAPKSGVNDPTPIFGPFLGFFGKHRANAFPKTRF